MSKFTKATLGLGLSLLTLGCSTAERATPPPVSQAGAVNIGAFPDAETERASAVLADVLNNITNQYPGRSNEFYLGLGSGAVSTCGPNQHGAAEVAYTQAVQGFVAEQRTDYSEGFSKGQGADTDALELLCGAVNHLRSLGEKTT